MFSPVPSKVSFPKIEEEILNFWKKNKIFEKSVAMRSGEDLYSFYDGPPFVTGMPHYGHLIVSIAKDVIPRFFTMKGKRVERVWGWDCHGLPVENKVEEKLGLKNRKEILKLGIDQFIAECRKYVSQVSQEWEWYIDRIGRWVDFKNAYRTMDLSYMESVIWVFQQLYKKGLIYRGTRVSLFCPRCSTPVSNFEIAMDNSYALLKDWAIVVKFPLTEKFKNSFLLAWTTTPWTIPSNRALVVAPKEQYVQVKVGGENLILGWKRMKAVIGRKQYRVKTKFLGKELLGLRYEPVYSFIPPGRNDFKVYAFEGMVDINEGTGIVHSAPGFGEIDTQMGKKFGLTLMMTVDDEGKFTQEIRKWAGIYVKDADEKIIADLERRNLLFKKAKITHRYPFCYRCQTPLIYKAQRSWFINVQKLKKLLLRTNRKIHWVPGHFKKGRFAVGIQNAPDWCISRTRYWATIMPVWECERCGYLKVVGSIEEIERLGGKKVNDLHRTGVDNIIFKCTKCGGTMKRIPEVLDCWLESGSMPYAQIHYPFENREKFHRSFPADYIVEYSAQVRGWFYVLHVISNALFSSHCFKNVVVTGVMMGTDGRKMSKSYGNYPDPKIVLKKYGGDALRLYLMSSPIMLGRDVNITKGEEIEEQVKRVLLPIWHAYRFFVTFANVYRFRPPETASPSHVLDRWIITRLHLLNREVSYFLERYHLPRAVKLIRLFVEDLSRWYIRRSRERFSRGDREALSTLYYVLREFCKITAPIIPFLSEKIFKELTGAESVHLCDWPKIERVERKLLEVMENIRKVCALGHAQRKQLGIKVRQPLARLSIVNCQFSIEKDLLQLIREELNVKEIVLKKGKGRLKVEFDTRITPRLKAEGEARELVRRIQELRKKQGCKLDEKIIVFAPSWPPEFEEFIKKQTLARVIKKGSCLRIER